MAFFKKKKPYLSWGKLGIIYDWEQQKCIKNQGKKNETEIIHNNNKTIIKS